MKSFFSSNAGKATIGSLGVAAVGGAAYVLNARLKSSQVGPGIRPDGTPLSMWTRMLMMTSSLLQSNDPLRGHTIYLVGFHPMTESPCHQMEAHHYCKQVNDDFAQCILFDSNTSDANITGIEYIISEKLFHTLHPDEQMYWHPHNYEILSGILTAPGLPTSAEKALLKTKMNSYGKTFHTWRAKCWEDEQPYRDTLPKGCVLLGWSFNHDGEVKKDVLEYRDVSMNVNTSEKREERKDMVKLANPQYGVNFLLPLMKHEIHSIEGIVDLKDVEKQQKKK